MVFKRQFCLIIIEPSKNKCPLNNKCLVENVMYKATIRPGNQTKNYLGSTSGTSKKRLYNNISNFKNYKKKDTEISKYILKLKSINIDYKIDWEIIHHIGKVKNLQTKKNINILILSKILFLNVCFIFFIRKN